MGTTDLWSGKGQREPRQGSEGGLKVAILVVMEKATAMGRQWAKEVDGRGRAHGGAKGDGKNTYHAKMMRTH